MAAARDAGVEVEAAAFGRAGVAEVLAVAVTGDGLLAAAAAAVGAIGARGVVLPIAGVVAALAQLFAHGLVGGRCARGHEQEDDRTRQDLHGTTVCRDCKRDNKRVVGNFRRLQPMTFSEVMGQ